MASLLIIFFLGLSRFGRLFRGFAFAQIITQGLGPFLKLVGGLVNLHRILNVDKSGVTGHKFYCRFPCKLGKTLLFARKARCCSSVVEHTLGKGEVESSILSCSTIFPVANFLRASVRNFCCAAALSVA